MHPTRVVNTKDSQAILIPAELAYKRDDIELSIRRVEDILIISPMDRFHEPTSSTTAGPKHEQDGKGIAGIQLFILLTLGVIIVLGVLFNFY